MLQPCQILRLYALIMLSGTCIILQFIFVLILETFFVTGCLQSNLRPASFFLSERYILDVGRGITDILFNC